MKPWGKWIQGRIQQVFSTEFIFTAAIVYIYYKLAMLDKLTAVFTGAIGPVAAYIWGRTRQKQNGG